MTGTTGNSTYMLQMYNAGSQCFMSLGQGSANGPLNGLVMVLVMPPIISQRKTLNDICN